MQGILVTGGLGFIGSNFIRHILTANDDVHVTNLDNLSFGSNVTNLADLVGNVRYRLEKGDINHIALVSKLLKSVGVVVNFAAQTHVDRSISTPEVFVQSNVMGTFALLEAERKADGRKFVQISTDEVYGSASGKSSFREDERLEPASPYSASKASADMLVQAYHKTYGINTVILRCTNNFGPYQFPEKFIPKTVISALLGRTVPIYGSGMQIRDWIHVLDFCKAIELATKKSTSGSIYNVSAGNELPNLEVSKLILKALGRTADLLRFVDDRPGHDFRYSLSSDKIRNELGWKTEHAFWDALQQTVKWYVANESWWKPLINDKVLSPSPWKHKW
jgi:dTDP-glucose 4,6-dehydratase